MFQESSKVFVHIIFSTWHCRTFIREAVRKRLEPCIVDILSGVSSYTEELYAHPDHLHVLCTLPPDFSPEQLISRVKTDSTLWLRESGLKSFSWQDGYAAFSVSPLKVGAVIKYLYNQPRHHQKLSWKDEMRMFYEFYQMDYDERYVWD